MISGIIMASGFSKRMGRDKLLIEIEGIPTIERVIKAALASTLGEVIVVYRNPKIKEICFKYDIKTIYNDRADLGQAQSVKLGILNSNEPDAYMFLVGDQPFLNSQLIDMLIEGYYKKEGSIVIPYCEGKRSMPMIMDKKFKDQLLEIEGDKGGRDVVDKHIDQLNKIEINDSKLCFDIDRPEDLHEIMK